MVQVRQSASVPYTTIPLPSFSSTGLVSYMALAQRSFHCTCVHRLPYAVNPLKFTNGRRVRYIHSAC